MLFLKIKLIFKSLYQVRSIKNINVILVIVDWDVCEIEMLLRCEWELDVREKVGFRYECYVSGNGINIKYHHKLKQ